MTKGMIDRNKLKEIIKERRLSMRELSLKAGMSESYIKDLVAGKIKSPTIERFIKVVDSLGIYPNTLIPLEWQEPISSEINPDILGKAVQDIIERAKNKENAESLLSFEKQGQLIAILYNKRIKEAGRLSRNGEVAKLDY